jgi:hypothetical protein
MLAALRSLVDWMGSDPLYVDEMVERMGSIIEDYGPNVLLRPFDPMFSTVNIVRCLDPATSAPTNTPAHLILTPVEPPPLKSLSEAFGEYREVPMRSPFPPRVIFYLDMLGSPYTVALIAEVQDGKATHITLRRDKR